MRLNKSTLPPDSILRHWLYAHSNLETPTSYLILTAMAAIGALLKRNVWFDQEHFKVYPNLSVFLVGPSGIGKDVAIDLAEEILQHIDTVRDVGGRTIESIYNRLARQGNPAAGYILAPEITAFVGKKDYQSGMIQDITDLLSTKPHKDYNLKDKEQRIMRPTVTMLAGSTAEWLQRNMPEGSQEGGFFPRFLIVTEQFVARHAPLPKHDGTLVQRQSREKAKEWFFNAVATLIQKWTDKPGEVYLSQEAMDWYRNWYHNRFKEFGPTVREYANRSRDQVLRVGMLCAVLRGKGWIDLVDCRFAHAVTKYTGQGLERTIKPVTQERRCAEAYLGLVGKGRKQAEIIRALRKVFDIRVIETAERALLHGEEIVLEKASGKWEVTKK